VSIPYAVDPTSGERTGPRYHPHKTWGRDGKIADVLSNLVEEPRNDKGEAERRRTWARRGHAGQLKIRKGESPGPGDTG
jgi:hypothetical protein